MVIVQLCVGDGVEDLMESLTVESDKSLTSQEPDSHHGVSSTAENLLGELSANLSQRTRVGGDQVSATTPRLLSLFRPRLRSSTRLVRCPSDPATGVLSCQPADQERQCGGEILFFFKQLEALDTHLKIICNKNIQTHYYRFE